MDADELIAKVTSWSQRDDRVSAAGLCGFYGETEAEFGITDEAWAEPPIDPETAGVINDGLRILYDPHRRLEMAVASAASRGR